MEMSTQRSNYPPTAAEVARINEFVKSRSQAIEFLRQSMSEEDRRVAESLDAIQNLKTVISQGKAAVLGYEADLEAFTSMRTRLNILNSMKKSTLPLEESSRLLYERMFDCAVASVDSRRVVVEEQVELVGTELRILIDAVRSLELELRGWNNTLNLANTAKESLLATIKREEKAISHAQAALSSVCGVPDEIWTSIFRLLIHSEIDNYFNVDQTEPLKPTQLYLAHVCRRWRELVQNEAAFWRFVYRPASHSWSASKLSLFRTCLSSSNRPLTILTNVSHAHSGDKMAPPDGVILRRDKQYTLHIDMFSDQRNSLDRMANLYSCKPSALIITCRRPLNNNYISDALPHFPSVTSLSILTKQPRTLLNLELSDYYPNITRLRIECTHWTTPFLPFFHLRATLKELHIRYDTSIDWILQDVVEFPSLRKLGLGVQPADHLLLRLHMPALVSFIMYGKHLNPTYFRSDSFVSGGPIDQDSEETTTEATARSEIIFEDVEDWKAISFDGRSRGWAEFIVALGPVFASLRTVKFTNCVINGDMLFALIYSFRQHQVVKDTILSKLEEVTFAQCTGLTRDQCDRLKQLFNKVNIYY